MGDVSSHLLLSRFNRCVFMLVSPFPFAVSINERTENDVQGESMLSDEDLRLELGERGSTGGHEITNYQNKIGPERTLVGGLVAIYHIINHN